MTTSSDLTPVRKVIHPRRALVEDTMPPMKKPLPPFLAKKTAPPMKKKGKKARPNIASAIGAKLARTAR